MSDTRDLPSGRFVLRLEPEHHAALREAADAADLSLNEYCVRKLAAPATTVEGPAGRAVRKAVETAGDALVGLVAFGSWARGEMAEGSDVDVLVVLEPEATLRRERYRRWDADPLFWEGHRVEPHFVRLPAPDDEVSGLWAEAAVDGAVLFERGLRVSRRLAAVRREIASGRLVRRESYGHPYWVRAA